MPFDDEDRCVVKPIRFAVRIPEGMHNSFADRVIYLINDVAPNEHRTCPDANVGLDCRGGIILMETDDTDAVEWWKGYAQGAVDALADRIMPECQSERCPACFDRNEQGFVDEYKAHEEILAKHRAEVEEDDPTSEFGHTLDNLDLAKIAEAGRKYQIDIVGDGVKDASFKASRILNPPAKPNTLDDTYRAVRKCRFVGEPFISWLDHIKKMGDDSSDDMREMWAGRAAAHLRRRNPALTELMDMYLEYSFGDESCNEAFHAWLDRIKEYGQKEDGVVLTEKSPES